MPVPETGIRVRVWVGQLDRCRAGVWKGRGREQGGREGERGKNRRRHGCVEGESSRTRERGGVSSSTRCLESSRKERSRREEERRWLKGKRVVGREAAIVPSGLVVTSLPSANSLADHAHQEGIGIDCSIGRSARKDFLEAYNRLRGR